jgi:hypothetical protein
VISVSHFAVVAARVLPAGERHLDAINEWWSEHAKDFAESERFTASWRFERISSAELPHYIACYEFDEVDDFTRALAAMTNPWGRLQDYIFDWVTGWTRTYYRLVQTCMEPIACKHGLWVLERFGRATQSPDAHPRTQLIYRTQRLEEMDDIGGAWLYENVSVDDGRARDPDRFAYLTIVDCVGAEAARNAVDATALGADRDVTLEREIFHAGHGSNLR